MKKLKTAFTGLAAGLFALSPLVHAEPQETSLSSEQATLSTSYRNSAYDGREFSLGEAYRASKGGIVLLQGEGVRDVDGVANDLREIELPVINGFGGKPGHVTLFVGKSKPLFYSQKEVDSGYVYNMAKVLYSEIVLGEKSDLIASTDTNLPSSGSLAVNQPN